MTALGVSHGPTLAPVETRGAGDYTDQILSGSFAAATGRIQAASVAGVQAAAGIVGRALSSATIDGDGGAVDAHLLEGIGTDLVRAGRFLGRLTVGPRGRVRILRACAAPSVTYGNSDPESWVYWLQEGGPSDARTVRATASRSRQRPNQQRLTIDRGKASRPWPVRLPAVSLPRGSPSSLGDEADVVVSRIIPISQGSGENAANQLSKAISGQLPGRARLWPETQLGGGRRRGPVECATFVTSEVPRGPGWEAPISGPTALRAPVF